MLKKIIGAPFFSLSIRVFFPMATLVAILIPMYTVTTLVNGYPFQTPHFSLLEWHVYEMLFGFFYTIIMGFLLTAGANWTGKKAPQGVELIILLLFWIFEQASLFFSNSPVVLITSSLLVTGYFLYLLTKLLCDYPKKIPILSIILALSTLKLLTISQVTSLSSLSFINKEQIYETSSYFIALLTSLISSRIIPNFTKNFFKLKESLVTPQILDQIFIFSATLLCATPFIPYPSLNSLIFIIAGLSGFIKMFYWHTMEALKKPIIGILHIGFFTLSLSFISRGLSFSFPQLEFTRASLHLMLAGGVSILALNIMTRAIQGHTGRKIESSKSFIFMNAVLITGLIIRFFVPVMAPQLFVKSLHHSMGFWSLAFIVFFFKYLPLSLKDRVKSSE